MANVIQFTIRGVDAATPAFRSVAAAAKRTSIMLRDRFRSLQSAVVSLQGAIAALGIGLAAKSFVTAASTAEQLRVRLRVLFGSVAEGNRLFADMSEFASKVPFQYEEIMQSATQLAGVVKNGAAEVNRYMPLIADLAATSGLTFRETTEQVIRMFSAGAGSADLFRERGILAMLGFEAGVSVSAEATKKRLIEAWEEPGSKFRGATDLLANTWEGLMSMMSDKWFQFRTMVMDAGLFDYFKAIANVVNEGLGQSLEDSKARAAAWANTIIDGLRWASKAVGVFANGFRGIHVIWLSLKVAWAAIVWFFTDRVERMRRSVQSLVNTFIGSFNDMIDKAPWLAEKLGIEKAALASFADGMGEDVQRASESLEQAQQEWHELMMRPLPSEAIEDFVARVETKFAELREISKLEMDEFMTELQDPMAEVVLTFSEALQEQFKAFMDEQKSFAEEFAKSMFKIMQSTAKAVGDSVGEILVDGKNASQAFQELAKNAIKQIISSYISMKIQRFIAAQALPPQAGANMLTTMSAAPFPINLTAPAMAAKHTAATAAYVAASAHGGMDFVPQEATYYLNRGERVLSPKQNQDLTAFLSTGAGGGTSIGNVEVNIYTTAQSFSEIDDTELEDFVGGRLIRTLDKLDDDGVRLKSLARINA